MCEEYRGTKFVTIRARYEMLSPGETSGGRGEEYKRSSDQIESLQSLQIQDRGQTVQFKVGKAAEDVDSTNSNQSHD